MLPLKGDRALSLPLSIVVTVTVPRIVGSSAKVRADRTALNICKDLAPEDLVLVEMERSPLADMMTASIKCIGVNWSGNRRRDLCVAIVVEAS